MKNRLPIFIFLFLTTLVRADEYQIKQLVSDFTRCDAVFFDTLKQQQATLPKEWRVEKIDKVAKIPVPNRLHEEHRTVLFDNPIDVNGIKVLGYSDQISSLEELGMGRFYFWGFLVSGTPQEVVAAWKPLIYEKDRLRFDVAHQIWVRSELRYLSDPIGQWRKQELAVNTAPQEGSIERVLIFVANSQEPTFVACSLQGSIPESLLKTERPDLSGVTDGK